MSNDGSKGEPPTAVQKDPLVGKVLNGKFRLVSLIGRGGMGKIYKAEQIPLNRPVAVKLLSIIDQNVNIAEFRERFFREASLCARLSHPNIVTIHDYGAVEGNDETLLIAMEYLEGRNLMERLKALGRAMAPAEATAIVIEIARGIREAHKHGIVHRDLKCSNVMLVPDEDGATRVKILDFGLVKSLTSNEEEEESLTRAGGGFLGSPGYMSPEQIQRGTQVDHRSDIYSLGVILFRCLAGRNPFEGDQAQVLIGHVNTPPPALRELDPHLEVPADLEAFMRRMLEKTVEKRASSAEEVIRTLREIQQANFWTARSAASFDTTGSFSKPRPLILEPTPPSSVPSGGSIAPFEVDGAVPPASGPSFRLALVAALLGLSALGLVIFLIVRTPAATPTDVHSTPIAAPSAATVPQPPAEPIVTKIDPPAVSPPQPTTAIPPITQPMEEPIALAPSHPSKHGTPKPSGKHSTPTAKIVATAPVTTTPVAVPASAEVGFLSLDTTPWSSVTEGGHVLGQTPLMKVKLSPGSHTLTLTTQSGVSRSFVVTIKAGQTVSKRLGLE